MEQHLRTGTPVFVHFDDGQQYSAQVMFTHFGEPRLVMVAWLDTTPPNHHDVADWVEASRITLAE